MGGEHFGEITYSEELGEEYIFSGRALFLRGEQYFFEGESTRRHYGGPGMVVAGWGFIGLKSMLAYKIPRDWGFPCISLYIRTLFKTIFFLSVSVYRLWSVWIG